MCVNLSVECVLSGYQLQLYVQACLQLFDLIIGTEIINFSLVHLNVSETHSYID